MADEDRALTEGLPEKYKAAILATGSYDEIAVKLDIKLGTVKSRISRARALIAARKEELAKRAAMALA